MSDEVRNKLKELEDKLDKYDPESGEKLPISLKDIYFILGACDGLERSATELEEAYTRDTAMLMQDVTKFRNKWKEARKLCVKQDNKIMRYKSVIETAKKLPFWRKSKALNAELKMTENFEKKNTIPDSNSDSATT